MSAAVKDFNVWEGVYRSFSEAPAEGPGFDGGVWRDRSLQAAREILAAVGSDEPLDYALRQRNAVLPGLVATALDRKSSIRILDLGGGLGTGFMLLMKTVPSAVQRVDYTVVESEGICRAGRELFEGEATPDFLPDLPHSGTFDIIHAASVMQYIKDWKGVVASLARFGATYLSFGDVFLGSFGTFVTMQNYYGSRIPHWFFNAEEFIREVERHNYNLALRSICDAKVLGVYGPLPMENFPPELRLKHTTHLLFTSKATA